VYINFEYLGHQAIVEGFQRFLGQLDDVLLAKTFRLSQAV
jgi:hypothetical protein